MLWRGSYNINQAPLKSGTRVRQLKDEKNKRQAPRQSPRISQASLEETVVALQMNKKPKKRRPKPLAKGSLSNII